VRSYIFALIFVFFSIFLYSQGKTQKVSIKYIEISGNYSFTKKEILNVLKIKEMMEYEIEEIKTKLDILKKFYVDNGYLLTKIDSYIGLDGIFYIIINEGIIDNTVFVNLDYFQIILVKDIFGDFKNVIFHKPTVEAKLSDLKSKIKVDFDYEFLNSDRDGHYILFLVRNQSKQDKTEDGKLKPYFDYYFNFRGWLLLLVPYFYVTFYNIGGIDHSLRFRVDIRFATENWIYAKFRESVIDEYYSVEYFTPPIYKDFKLNINTGIFINRSGRGDLGLKYKLIRYPFEVGGGFDFKYFWASLRGGMVYLKFRNPENTGDGFVQFDPFNYPELTGEYDKIFKTISLSINYSEPKKYHKEKDNFIRFSLTHFSNENYKWISLYAKSEYFFIFDYDLIALRFKSFMNIGKFPGYYAHTIVEDFYLRGYKDEPIFTDRGLAGGFEYWNSFYTDKWHTLFFIDFAYFNNQTYKSPISIGDFETSYGIGISYSFEELNLRFSYSLALKSRADSGKFDFFFRKRF